MLLLFKLLFQSFSSHALPIVFGINQGDLQYSEIISKYSYIYHDKRTPHEGAMTANTMKGDREKCLEAGMDDYVTKPINVQKFSYAIDSALFVDGKQQA